MPEHLRKHRTSPNHLTGTPKHLIPVRGDPDNHQAVPADTTRSAERNPRAQHTFTRNRTEQTHQTTATRNPCTDARDHTHHTIGLGLRIRRLGVRVPPSARESALVRRGVGGRCVAVADRNTPPRDTCGTPRRDTCSLGTAGAGGLPRAWLCPGLGVTARRTWLSAIGLWRRGACSGRDGRRR